ncbi:formyltransferase family protein [Kitasatospora phosalacinea]|uniref:formyltransferase family protein n=1 Tax=Kitasatospora phosalacinea TaxID=2065 RepID=UPI0035DEFF3F
MNRENRVLPVLGNRTAPLRVAVLVSATGANLTTLLQLSKSRPDLLEVVLVASDRPRAGALDVARQAEVTTWPGDFTASCGRWSQCRTDQERADYRRRARDFHNRLNERIADFERREGGIDLVVLAYHRWIQGDLLHRFRHRMINQHPGDLSVLTPDGDRAFIGMDPVGLALEAGRAATRTSTFLVDETEDGGPLLALGPEVPYTGPRPPSREQIDQHELRQKVLSDRPALVWTIEAIGTGRLAIDEQRRHADGSSVVLLDNRSTPLGGHRLGAGAADAPSFGGTRP